MNLFCRIYGSGVYEGRPICFAKKRQSPASAKTLVVLPMTVAAKPMVNPTVSPILPAG